MHCFRDCRTAPHFPGRSCKFRDGWQVCTLIEALKETRLKSVASDLENMFGMLSYVVNAIDYFVLLHYSVDQYQPVQYQNSDGTTSQSLQKMYMSCSINGNNYYDI